MKRPPARRATPLLARRYLGTSAINCIKREAAAGHQTRVEELGAAMGCLAKQLQEKEKAIMDHGFLNLGSFTLGRKGA